MRARRFGRFTLVFITRRAEVTRPESPRDPRSTGLFSQLTTQRISGPPSTGSKCKGPTLGIVLANLCPISMMFVMRPSLRLYRRSDHTLLHLRLWGKTMEDEVHCLLSRAEPESVKTQ